MIKKLNSLTKNQKKIKFNKRIIEVEKENLIVLLENSNKIITDLKKKVSSEENEYKEKIINLENDLKKNKSYVKDFKSRIETFQSKLEEERNDKIFQINTIYENLHKIKGELREEKNKNHELELINQDLIFKYENMEFAQKKNEDYFLELNDLQNIVNNFQRESNSFKQKNVKYLKENELLKYNYENLITLHEKLQKNHQNLFKRLRIISENLIDENFEENFEINSLNFNKIIEILENFGNKFKNSLKINDKLIEKIDFLEKELNEKNLKLNNSKESIEMLNKKEDFYVDFFEEKSCQLISSDFNKNKLSEYFYLGKKMIENHQFFEEKKKKKENLQIEIEKIILNFQEKLEINKENKVLIKENDMVLKFKK